MAATLNGHDLIRCPLGPCGGAICKNFSRAGACGGACLRSTCLVIVGARLLCSRGPSMPCPALPQPLLHAAPARSKAGLQSRVCGGSAKKMIRHQVNFSHWPTAKKALLTRCAATPISLRFAPSHPWQPLAFRLEPPSARTTPQREHPAAECNWRSLHCPNRSPVATDVCHPRNDYRRALPVYVSCRLPAIALLIAVVVVVVCCCCC